MIDYTVRVDREFSMNERAFDVEVEVEDPMQSHLELFVHATDDHRDLPRIEDRITEMIETINTSRLKRDFMLSFARDPSGFTQKWLKSQAQDMKIVFGEAVISAEDLRYFEMFQQPWTREAVTHYLSEKVRKRGVIMATWLTYIHV